MITAYVVRPHNPHSYFYLSSVPVYGARPVEMSEDEIRSYCGTLQDFNIDQGKLSRLYKPLTRAEEWAEDCARESLQ